MELTKCRNPATFVIESPDTAIMTCKQHRETTIDELFMAGTTVVRVVLLDASAGFACDLSESD
jgi:hypothetical protein